jgi:hypothetical protein
MPSPLITAVGPAGMQLGAVQVPQMNLGLQVQPVNPNPAFQAQAAMNANMRLAEQQYQYQQELQRNLMKEQQDILNQRMKAAGLDVDSNYGLNPNLYARDAMLADEINRFRNEAIDEMYTTLASADGRLDARTYALDAQRIAGDLQTRINNNPLFREQVAVNAKRNRMMAQLAQAEEAGLEYDPREFNAKMDAIDAYKNDPSGQISLNPDAFNVNDFVFDRDKVNDDLGQIIAGTMSEQKIQSTVDAAEIDPNFFQQGDALAIVERVRQQAVDDAKAEALAAIQSRPDIMRMLRKDNITPEQFVESQAQALIQRTPEGDVSNISFQNNPAAVARANAAADIAKERIKQAAKNKEKEFDEDRGFGRFTMTTAPERSLNRIDNDLYGLDGPGGDRRITKSQVEWIANNFNNEASELFGLPYNSHVFILDEENMQTEDFRKFAADEAAAGREVPRIGDVIATYEDNSYAANLGQAGYRGVSTTSAQRSAFARNTALEPISNQTFQGLNIDPTTLNFGRNSITLNPDNPNVTGNMGYRNNNPLNMRPTASQLRGGTENEDGTITLSDGTVAVPGGVNGGYFVKFGSMADGLNFATQDILKKMTGRSPALRGNMEKRGRAGEEPTLADLIETWSPREQFGGEAGLNTDAAIDGYIRFAGEALGVDPFTTTLESLVPRAQEVALAMTAHEAPDAYIALLKEAEEGAADIGITKQLGETPETNLPENLITDPNNPTLGGSPERTEFSPIELVNAAASGENPLITSALREQNVKLPSGQDISLTDLVAGLGLYEEILNESLDDEELDKAEAGYEEYMTALEESPAIKKARQLASLTPQDILEEALLPERGLVEVLSGKTSGFNIGTNDFTVHVESRALKNGRVILRATDDVTDEERVFEARSPERAVEALAANYPEIFAEDALARKVAPTQEEPTPNPNTEKTRNWFAERKGTNTSEEPSRLEVLNSILGNPDELEKLQADEVDRLTAERDSLLNQQ